MASKSTFQPSRLYRHKQNYTGLFSCLIWATVTCVSVCAGTFETTSAPDAVRRSTNSFASSEKENVRSAMAHLIHNIKNLPDAKGKVPPLVTDPEGRPKVTVDVSLTVLLVLTASNVQDSIKTIGIAQFQWRDPALAWNPANVSDLDVVEVTGGSIWSPSVIIVNSFPQTNILPRDTTRFIKTFSTTENLDSKSQAFVSARTVFSTETLCHMNLNHYPFDRQTCPLSIVSGSKFVHLRVKLQNGTDIAASQSVDGEWALLSTKVKPFFVEQYDETGVMVLIEIERKTTFYIVCLMLPMILTSYMNTLVFLLPFENGEKVSFVVTILVSASVYIGFVTGAMPRGLNSVPNILKLLIGFMVEGLVVLILTIIVVRRFDQQRTRKTDRSSRFVGYERKGEGNSSSSVLNRILNTLCSRFGSGKFPLGRRLSQASNTTSSSSVGSPISQATSHRSSDISPIEDEAAQNPEQQAVEEGLAGDPAGGGSRVAMCLNPTAEQLDWVFFLLSFGGNTLFLIVLLFNC